MVSCGSGGLVVAHVGRRLLLASTPRQCAMPLLLVGPAPLPVSRGFLFFCDKFIFLLFFPYHIRISLDTHIADRRSWKRRGATLWNVLVSFTVRLSRRGGWPLACLLLFYCPASRVGAQKKQITLTTAVLCFRASHFCQRQKTRTHTYTYLYAFKNVNLVF